MTKLWPFDCPRPLSLTLDKNVHVSHTRDSSLYLYALNARSQNDISSHDEADKRYVLPGVAILMMCPCPSISRSTMPIWLAVVISIRPASKECKMVDQTRKL